MRFSALHSHQTSRWLQTLCEEPVGYRRCGVCRTGQLVKQWAPPLGSMPQPLSLLRFEVCRRRQAEERLKASVLLTEHHCVARRGWLWHPVGDRASVRGRRAAFRTSEHNGLVGQLQERARVHNETETHTQKDAPVALEGGKWRGVVAQRAREPGTARYSRQPAPPLGTHTA